MRKFSRWMPPAPDPAMTKTGWLILAGLFIALVAAVIAWPALVGTICGASVVAIFILLVLGHSAGNQHLRYLRRLAAERRGEDIGTFARSFDRREEPFDPWVVRAAWEALQPYVVLPEGPVPLRPTDRLEEDLCIDPDDIHFCLYDDIAARAGRSLDRPDANPLYGRVVTVGDLIQFITLQPRVMEETIV